LYLQGDESTGILAPTWDEDINAYSAELLFALEEIDMEVDLVNMFATYTLSATVDRFDGEVDTACCVYTSLPGGIAENYPNVTADPEYVALNNISFGELLNSAAPTSFVEHSTLTFALQFPGIYTFAFVVTAEDGAQLACACHLQVWVYTTLFCLSIVVGHKQNNRGGPNNSHSLASKLITPMARLRGFKGFNGRFE
jgi:hypothetical protein